MGDYHLFAHMDLNKVKKGAKVIKYVTPIGTLGDGNGQYWAHLHHNVSHDLPVSEVLKYVHNWTLEKMKTYYRNPLDIGVDYNKMFGRKMDVGVRGYKYGDWIGTGYHPGMDVNGLDGGNTDFGWQFTSSCTGTVIYEWRGWTSNGGWGNIILCEEDEPPIDCEKCKLHCPN